MPPNYVKSCYNAHNHVTHFVKATASKNSVININRVKMLLLDKCQVHVEFATLRILLLVLRECDWYSVDTRIEKIMSVLTKQIKRFEIQDSRQSYGESISVPGLLPVYAVPQERGKVTSCTFAIHLRGQDVCQSSCRTCATAAETFSQAPISCWSSEKPLPALATYS